MHFTSRSGLPLIVAFLSICLQARCDPISNQTFTYPRGANSSSPDVSDLFIHINDSVVVEYTILPSTTAVGIDVICYQSILDAQVNETWIFSDTADYGGRENLQHYENTGKIKFDLRNDTGRLKNGGPYCRFMLFNDTIDNCSWDPWDPSLNMGANYSIPLFYSAVFQGSSESNWTHAPVIWTSSGVQNGTSNTSSTVAASIVEVVCPQSGIPPKAIPVYRLDIWPPLADNAEIPQYNTGVNFER